MLAFEWCSGSVIGYDHVRLGKNNQDALNIVSSDTCIIGLVVDGCGSGSHSELGAQWASECLLTLIHNAVKSEWYNWDVISSLCLQQLSIMISSMGSFLSPLPSERLTTIPDLLMKYFHFTLLGVCISPQMTTIFSIGDGVYAVNGDITVIEPEVPNTPPYLVYGLLDRPPIPWKFSILHQGKTEDLCSVLIGTDGIAPYVNQPEKHGSLAQFWREDIFYKNPYKVSRKFRSDSHFLNDDATVISIRRKGN